MLSLDALSPEYAAQLAEAEALVAGMRKGGEGLLVTVDDELDAHDCMLPTVR